MKRDSRRLLNSMQIMMTYAISGNIKCAEAKHARLWNVSTKM